MEHYKVRITAYDATTMAKVRTFDSMKEACEWLGGYKMSNLSSHMGKRHHPKQIHGYVFKKNATRKPKPFDWNPQVPFIYWMCHQVCKPVVPRYHEDAWEYVLHYVCRHLPQYRGKTTPETHIKRAAEWGLLQWYKEHYRHVHPVTLDDDGWKVVGDTAIDVGDGIQRILEEMPEQFRTIAEARLDGMTHEETMRAVGMDGERYNATLKEIRRWIRGDWHGHGGRG